MQNTWDVQEVQMGKRIKKFRVHKSEDFSWHLSRRAWALVFFVKNLFDGKTRSYLSCLRMCFLWIVRMWCPELQVPSMSPFGSTWWAWAQMLCEKIHSVDSHVWWSRARRTWNGACDLFATFWYSQRKFRRDTSVLRKVAKRVRARAWREEK